MEPDEPAVSVTLALGGPAKDRKDAFERFKDFLRQISSGFGRPNPPIDALNRVFETLFNAIVKEKVTWLRVKKAGKAPAESRLISFAEGLRFAVETTGSLLKSNKLGVLLSHLLDTLRLPRSQALCQPIALDYLKTLRTLLSHQPHLEHITHQDWTQSVDFCLGFFRSISYSGWNDSDSADPNTPSDSSFPQISSYRASRSFANHAIANHAGRQFKTEEEVLGVLLLLTGSTNAPLRDHHAALLDVLLDYLHHNPHPQLSHSYAFASINNLLTWTRIESTNATRMTVAPTIRIIRSLWQSKNKELMAHMLVTLLYLRPYFSLAVDQLPGLPLEHELRCLFDTMRSEYGKRHENKSQLQIDDLELDASIVPCGPYNQVTTGIFQLRSSTDAAEQYWGHVNVLATISNTLHEHDSLSIEALETDIDDSGPPRKRQKVVSVWEDLLSNADTDIFSRISTLQIIAFAVQQDAISAKWLLRIVGFLVTCAAEEVATASSWAFLGLAACATQSSSSHKSLSNVWTTAWQLATRAIRNPFTCRASSSLLHLMMQLRLVPQSSTLNLIRDFTVAMDVHGPSALSDSVASFLVLTLRFCQESNPGSASTLANNVLAWALRYFTPSKFGDRSFASLSHTLGARQVTTLLQVCMNHPISASVHAGPRIRYDVSQAWIRCEMQHEMISYLLLLPSNKNLYMHPLMHSKSGPSRPNYSIQPRILCETACLDHFHTEVAGAQEVWDDAARENYRMVTSETLQSLFQSCCILICILHNSQFADSRRQSIVQHEVANLLSSLATFVSSSHCDHQQTNAVIGVFAQFCDCFCSEHEHEQFFRHHTVLCSALSSAFASKNAETDFGSQSDAVRADFDDEFVSQESRHKKPEKQSPTFKDDVAVAHSYLALQSSTALYAAIIHATCDDSIDSDEYESPATRITDYILSLSPASICASRRVLDVVAKRDITFSAANVERLLEFCTMMLRSYTYNCSEVAVNTVLDIMACFVAVWTDSTHGDLFDIGVDVYVWLTNTVSGKLSPSVERRIAQMLLKLHHIDPDYGRDRENEISSARTNLFELLKCRIATVQFYLAANIPAIFSKFVLQTHERMFDDLQPNLPRSLDWPEGMAIRVLFLSNLASSWKSLLRQCIYYIFEAAGQSTSTMRHAKHCVAKLTPSLGLSSPSRVFQLFAPQLFFTWLTNNTLETLPYEVFHYTSLEDILRQNEIEISAQVMARGDEKNLQILLEVLRTTPKALMDRAFAKTLAYAISWDVSARQSESNKDNELRLRNLFDSKDKFKQMVVEHSAAILGHFFLTVQQGDVEETWLQRKSAYSAASKAYEEIKTYSSSGRSLPPSQQPSFSPKYLLDRIERLCRRTGDDPVRPWNTSSLALVARMLLNGIDEALGSLHNCLQLRRLRLLVSIAGETAVVGYPLELLLRSLRPLLNDSECADDAMGILHYLFDHGREYLEKVPAFTNGTTLLTILKMCEHSAEQPKSITQETQHVRTVAQMRSFHAWLVTYLRGIQGQVDGVSDLDSRFTTALAGLHLPGNAQKGSPECTMLMCLLELRSSRSDFISRTDCTEALTLLSEGFKPPEMLHDDPLNDDEDAVRFSDELWNVLHLSQWSSGFTLWAAQGIGRAYAATGVRPLLSQEYEAERAATDAASQTRTFNSQSHIISKLCDLSQSQDLTEASIADYTLRRIAVTISTPNEESDFGRMLPQSLMVAIWQGPLGYEPVMATMPSIQNNHHDNLRQALLVTPSLTDGEWFRRFALALSSHGSEVPIIASIPHLFQNIENISEELLAPMIHILLFQERGGNTILKHELSASVSAHLEDQNPVLRTRQRFFVHLLLYLRKQALPGEATKADRFKWLNVDLLQAAEAALRCHMPTTALLLAETVVNAPPSNRRMSSRVSTSQSNPRTQLTDDLLLSIFRQIDEPDSFYGVKQKASVGSVLSRLEFEADGLKSLMFRSAQMDGNMRLDRSYTPSDVSGTIQSLAMLNLNSLTYMLTAGGVAGASANTENMLDAARNLQQWDVTVPEGLATASSAAFSVFQQLSRVVDANSIKVHLRQMTIDLTVMQQTLSSLRPPSSWWNTLASLVEITEVLDVVDDASLKEHWRRMMGRQTWTQAASYHDCRALIRDRSTLFSTLSHNTAVLDALHVTANTCRLLEAESLVEYSRFARSHGVLQESLSTANQLHLLAAPMKKFGLVVDSVAKLEVASAFWAAGETTASVQMLRDILASSDSEFESVVVGRSGLLAQLAHQLAEARLERPDDILSSYLVPAIEHLKGRTDGDEAGEVYHEFATFCDQQLQNPGNAEDFNRITKLRQKKKEELAELEQLRAAKKSGQQKHDVDRLYRQTKTWISVDDAEYRRLKGNRDTFVQQSLQNYLLALQASNKHNIGALRFFALWLENSDSPKANELVEKHLPSVPCWKFVLLLNQLMSRLEQEKSSFQTSLKALAVRLCSEHPYHSLHHLYAFTRKANKPGAASSRYHAATEIRQVICKDAVKGELLGRFFKADNHYQALAITEVTAKSKNSKISIKEVPFAEKVSRAIPELKLPPATIDLTLRPDSEYSRVPIVHKFSSTLSIMGGISAPKMLTAIASDGKEYKQLFKAGNDDLRQDAIMEQVFEEVSKMLRNHKATRQRDLHVRTYKVIPLSATSGIIEFVANTVPLDEFLQPAHRRYHPHDMSSHEAREKIASVKDQSTDTRVKEFRKICERIQPVLRHFFFERFQDPDDWFAKRTAYTRTTAAMSMLGHVLGLGDRHCSNILLDERSGEAVHIDLGIAFEAGRVLPIPELVPFRLTRDIVDGMGVTKTEGVFRRSCEFTMDALREDKERIMTLLNVLRYDPLHSWTVSPLRAKRMQDAARNASNGNGEQDESLSRKKEQEAGEADRALSIVEKKLSTTLSTAATVNELIQQATDERNLGTLFQGWAAFF